MAYKELKAEVLDHYENQRPIRLGGKFVQFEDIHEVIITTSLLKDDEIELFALKKGFRWKGDKASEKAFANACDDETNLYLPNPHIRAKDNGYQKRDITSELKILLVPYPESRMLYEAALMKFDKEELLRNSLDDLRLSLEYLVKGILGNNKSLENQKSELGKYMHEKGAHTEIRNQFQKMLDLYTSFPNSHVKHGNSSDKQAGEFILNQTESFMRYLLKL